MVGNDTERVGTFPDSRKWHFSSLPLLFYIYLSNLSVFYIYLSNLSGLETRMNTRFFRSFPYKK